MYLGPAYRLFVRDEDDDGVLKVVTKTLLAELQLPKDYIKWTKDERTMRSFVF